MYGSFICVTGDELDTGDDDETNNEENVGRNNPNEDCGVSDSGDADELGGIIWS